MNIYACIYDSFISVHVAGAALKTVDTQLPQSASGACLHLFVPSLLIVLLCARALSHTQF